MILKTAQNKETRQKQASNIKGSCSSHRTKDRKEEQIKADFSDRNSEGRDPMSTTTTKTPSIIFLEGMLP